MSDKTFFDKLLDPEIIESFLAYREERRTPDFRMNPMREYLLSDRYKKDVQRIRTGDYDLSVPVKKLIPKGYTNKKRTVYHFEEDEMSLFRIMAYVLHDYEHLFSEHVYSFRRGLSAKNLILRIRNNKSLRSMYIVKSDIVSYGNSIVADRLIEMLKNTLGKTEPEAVNFFVWLLQRREFIQDGQLLHGDTSALPGCPIHNFFTNLYLTEMDQLLSPSCVFYARFSDDVIMFVENRETAARNYELLLEKLKEYGLTPHQDEKTGLYDPGAPFDYLGFHFDGNEVDIAKASLKKLKRKMRIRAKRIGLDKKKRYASPEDKAKHLVFLNHRLFYGKPGSSDLSWTRWAFPVITRTDALHELDLYSQRCLRFLLSGKWSDAQYRISYEKLKELGYESLVRAYYNQDEDIWGGNGCIR